MLSRTESPITYALQTGDYATQVEFRLRWDERSQSVDILYCRRDLDMDEEPEGEVAWDDGVSTSWESGDGAKGSRRWLRRRLPLMELDMSRLPADAMVLQKLVDMAVVVMR